MSIPLKKLEIDQKSVIELKADDKKEVLLIKRELEQDEADCLQKHMDVEFFNPRVHLEKKIDSLLAKCEILVVPIYLEPVKNWFEMNEKLINRNTTVVILLERKSYKTDEKSPYGEDYIRKSIPVKCVSRDDYLFSILSNHMPKVEAKWKRFLKALVCCISKAL